MALFWEMGAVLGARGFGMRACPSRGRCLPRGDGVGKDREILAGFCTFGPLFASPCATQTRTHKSQQVACFALLLLPKN